MIPTAAELAERLQQGTPWDVWAVVEAASFLPDLDPEFFSIGAVAARRVNRPVDAVGFLSCATALRPEDGDLWCELGHAWYEVRQLAAAEQAWLRASSLGKLDPLAERRRKAAALAKGRDVLDCDTRLEQVLARPLVNIGAVESFVTDPQIRLPVLFTMGESRRKQAALTIDDGPSPDVTPGVLDTLAKLNVKAVFFLVGSAAEQYPELVERMVAEGHAVLGHSWSHTPFTLLSEREIVEELERTEQVLARHRPTPSPYPFRLPGGMGWPEPRIHAAIRSWSPDAVIVHWNVDTSDVYAPLTFPGHDDIRLDAKLRAIEVVLDPEYTSALILMHDRMIGLRRGEPEFYRLLAEEMVGQVRGLGMEVVLPDWAAILAEQVGASAQASPAGPGSAAMVSNVGYEVVRIDSANIGQIARDRDIGGLPLASYIRAAQLPWINHDHPYGYGLTVAGRFVGWLQSFYADRTLHGRMVTICNLSAWWVEEGHRSASMRLMFAALRDAGDIPVTILTPSGVAARIYAGMKFKLADTDRFAVAIPEHGPPALGEPETVFLELRPDAKKVFNDHRGFDLHHCLVQRDDRQCYFTYLTRERFDIWVADMLYFDGDLELLRDGWTAPAATPLATCARLLIDRRFFGDIEPWGEPMNPFNPRLYRGPAELRPDIDFLYGEVPVYKPTLM